MNRSKIYTRYIKLVNLYADETSKINQDDFIEYTTYKTKDTGVEFAIANISSKRSIRVVSTDENGNNILKIPLAETIHGKTVIGFNWGFGSLEITEETVVFDFSSCDLSNILEINFSGLLISSTKCKDANWYLKLPTLESKRLKPVSILGIFGSKVNDVADSVLSSMDLSELRIISNLFKNSDLEEFNFNRYGIRHLVSAASTFSCCHRLKRVIGDNIGELTQAYFMFAFCENLEYISPGIFKGANLISTINVLSWCKNLKNIPFSVKNVIKGLNETFVMCDSIDSTVMHKFLLDCYNEGVTFDKPLKKCSGRYTACKSRVRLECMAKILHGAEYTVVDLSEVEFIDNYDETCVFMLFMLNRRDLDNTLPKIVIVNSSICIDDTDTDFFEIIHMKGYSKSEVEMKINLILSMGHDDKDRYIIEV